MDSFESYKAAVGKNIQRRRLETGLSLRSFGMMVDVHYNQLLHIEQGRANPSLGTLYKIAQGLSIDIRDLLPEAT